MSENLISGNQHSTTDSKFFDTLINGNLYLTPISKCFDTLILIEKMILIY